MKPRTISEPPSAFRFGPLDKGDAGDSQTMSTDELEALRLVDYEGLMQEEAALRMGVSRGTVWRCLASARFKTAKMLVEATTMEISDGMVDEK
jgi:predicted DNA-binding protein (UPF0251 family)